MKLTKKIAWPSIFVISGLIWALLGHFFWHKSYSTEKPVNWDKPLNSVPYTDSLSEDTTLINHSELKPLATAQ